MVFKILYFATCLIALLELILFYETSSKNLNKNFLLLYVTTFISNLGYTLLVFSHSLEAAFAGNFFSYMGSIYTIFFMFLVIVDICNKKIPFGCRLFLLLYAILITSMIATTGSNRFFYKDAYFTTLYGFSFIETKNGPGMGIYIIYLAIINVAAISIIVTTLIQNKKVSKNVLFSMLAMIVVGTLAYIIPLAVGIKINFMPFTYIVLQTYFLFFVFRVNTYDLAGNVVKVLNQRDGYGYIAFDYKKRLLGYDNFAKEVFPSLAEIPLDSTIPNSCSDLINQLHYNDKAFEWSKNSNKDFKISKDDISVICTMHNVTSRKKTIGFLLELRDDTEQQNYINAINTFNKELSKMVREKTMQVTTMEDSIIRGMAIMVESRDNSTGGHILRTSDCIKIFADELLKNKESVPGINQEFCTLLIKAAPMHDLGKIAVDDSILRKPDKFEPAEYEQMKTHAEKGAIIVKEVLRESSDKDFERIAVNVAHYHHEKWNGKGYPNGLHGEEIPLEARIMALVDVFDALVSRRCYKNEFSFDEAFEIIKNDLGQHFDPVIGKIFIQCRPKIEEYYTKMFNMNDQ